MNRQDLQIQHQRQAIVKYKQANEQLKEELVREQEIIVQLSLERDRFIEENRTIRQQLTDFQSKQNEILEQTLHGKQSQDRQLQEELQQLKVKYNTLNEQHNYLKIEFEGTKEHNKSLKQKFVNSEKDPNKRKEMQDYLSQKETIKRELDEERAKLTKLREQMSNILNENRILRKLAEVPDNYGFNLEEIQLAEKEKMEDYKKQVRQLEREVEELEKERAQLRQRLRTAILANKDGKIDKEQLAANYDNEEDSKSENNKLKNEIALLKQNQQGAFQNNGPTEDQLKQLKEDIAEMIKQNSNQPSEQQQELGSMIKTANDLNNFKQINTQNQLHPDLQPFRKHGIPPNPLLGRAGDVGNINEGYTNRFGENGQKIPIDLYDLYTEGGFDQIMAKQEIANLQLMNIENIKILQEKEKEYQSLYSELQMLKDSYTQSLLIQDNLFEQHYTEKKTYEQEKQLLEEQIKNLQGQMASQEVKIKNYEDNFDDFQSQNQQTLQGKLAAMVRSKAVLEVNLIQVSRKYAALKSDYDDISEKYLEIDRVYSNKEQKYVHRIQSLLDWKKKSSVQMKVLFEELKQSVPQDQLYAARQEAKTYKDQMADFQVRYSKLQEKIRDYRGYEREVDEKNDLINQYQEEILDINVEMEIIKKRLEETDPVFRRYQNFFGQLVKLCKNRSLSPQEIFAQFDKNGDRKLSEEEFKKAMDNYMDCDPNEVATVFMFMDLDGNKQIDYKEFIKRLGRAGVSMRREEEQIIYDLYRKIKNAGKDLRGLFSAIDRNFDNSITKQELQEGFQDLNIQVDEKILGSIFEMADISRDGTISYDEFRSLFENVISDQIRQDIIATDQELDIRKQIILQIDESIRDMGYSLIDIYKIIDSNNDQKITVDEFKKLFKRLDINFKNKDIQQLFSDIDKDNNQDISYNELLAYVREAKKEQAKIERMRKINERVEEIKKQNFYDDREEEVGENINVMQRMQMKMSMLELREKNSQNRLNEQKRKLMQISKENASLNMKLDELEKEVVKAHGYYYEARQKANTYLEKAQSCISKDESDRLTSYKQAMLIENSELKAALSTFKSLYLASVDQVKVKKLTLEKRQHQKQIMQELMDNIKKEQATSDDKSLIGKLYHQLMISRWQQGEINKKYDNIYDENQQDKIKIQNFEKECNDKEDELIYIHSEYNMLKRKLENEINLLEGKIIPTVSHHKIDEMHNILSETVQQKLDLEITNRNLKQINNELQLKCDYYETARVVREEIKQVGNNPDSLEHKIHEFGNQITELKQAEWRAKREAAVAKEKEEYYQRINRQHNESIKLLEQEISQIQKKANEREEYWRKENVKQTELIFKVQDTNEKLQKDDQKDFENLLNKGQKRQLEQQVKQQRQQGSQFAKAETGQIDESVLLDKDRKIKQLEEDLSGQSEQIHQLMEDIKQLKEENMSMVAENGKITNRQSRLTRQDQQDVEYLTKKAIDEESAKFTQAAQKTIQTLQQLIDEKNEHIKSRDRLIEKMRKDFVVEKEKDIGEIRRLNNQLSNNNMSVVQKMNASIVQHNGQVMESAAYWGDVGQLLHEKDAKMTDISEKLEQSLKQNRELRNQLAEEREKCDALEGQIEIEKGKNETGKLMKEVEQTRKLYKQKDQELQKIKAVIKQLKDDQFKLVEESETAKDEKMQIIKEDKSKIEMKQQQVMNALNDVKKLNKEIQVLKQKMEKQNQEQMELKEQNTKLKEQNRTLLRGEGARGEKTGSSQGGQENSNFQLQFNTKVKELEKEINRLQTENKEMKAKLLVFSKSGNQQEDILDQDGQLQGKSLYFQSLQELISMLKQWALKTHTDLLGILKTNDRQKEGVISVKEFFKTLENNGVRIKERDQRLVQNSETLVNVHQNLNLVQFAYMLKGNLSSKGQGTNLTMKDLEKGAGGISIQSDDKQFGSSVQKLSTTREQERQRSQLNSNDMMRKISQLDRQLGEVRKEKSVLETQLKNWKEKALKLEKEINQINQNPKLGSSLKKSSSIQMAGIASLKDQIYEMEDVNEKLKLQLHKKEVEIQKLGEEKNKLEEGLKKQKVENMKQRQKLDDYLVSKLGEDQLIRETKSEKDVIIRNLETKLEEQRKIDQDLTNKYYDTLTENKELAFIRENYELNVERLQRRIIELEEYKKLYTSQKEKGMGSSNQSSSSITQNTLKKGYARKY
ncbi:hypothetical protein PPERSA_06649 [Pseudocohnilembus persalinus]|uniref:EF-hand domain-containing protein n=1 Tax=Pseudocohnilembus persalinus TaxID=266149 RepID=A0A0V0QS74_PSEPJ|nr:hypothetical protein PPERSA_06649 [Pseudocohnilembus persalinus]|eukprot:KRX05015.1 hypothetical protein PPERSA_06649 [Pseudocohnilembus persalinus]